MKQILLFNSRLLDMSYRCVFAGDLGYSNEGLEGENKVKYWIIIENYAFFSKNVKTV